MLDQRIEAVQGRPRRPSAADAGALAAPEFRARDPDTTKWVADMIRATPVAGMIGCAQAIQTLDYTGPARSAIALPTLVIAGEKDPGTSVAAMQAIHEQIKGSQLAVIPRLPAPDADRGAGRVQPLVERIPRSDAGIVDG